MREMIDRQLGNYEISEKIGQGWEVSHQLAELGHKLTEEEIQAGLG